MRIKSVFIHISRLFLLIFLSGILFFSLSGVYAQERENYQAHETSIDKVRQGIQAHLEKIVETGVQEVSLLDQLEQIDKKLSVQKERIAKLQRQLQVQEVVFTVREEDFILARESKESATIQLKTRLRSYYLMGGVGFLNVLFSDKDLPELIIFHDSYKKLLAYDQSIIDNYRATISMFEGATLARETAKEVLKKIIDQNRQEQFNLGIIRKEQQQLLARIQTQKGLHEHAVRKMQRAEENLILSLANLKKKHKNKAQGFLINKGRHFGPVQGRLIVDFGETVEGGISKGIIIASKDGAEVFSIFAGRVIFSGYKTGYGNTIIIDHGLLYYTITARLDTILVKEGQQVSTKQKTGTTGGIATLFSKGLYFEIRHGSKPLDPLEWLRPGIYEKN